jgi:hypothetical protein
MPNPTCRILPTAVLATFLVALLACAPVWAQNEETLEPEAEYEAQAEEVTQPKSKKDAGPFAKGRKRVGFYAGAGGFYNQTYVILGAGIGYYVADGLELGFDAEGWLFQDPTMWKLTPHLRYVVWQAGNLKPYLGAFYRWNLIDDPFKDYNSYGGRAGLAYQKGGNYAAFGVVYEIYEDDIFGDSSSLYPEIAFWISF